MINNNFLFYLKYTMFIFRIGYLEEISNDRNITLIYTYLLDAETLKK